MTADAVGKRPSVHAPARNRPDGTSSYIRGISERKFACKTHVQYAPSGAA